MCVDRPSAVPDQDRHCLYQEIEVRGTVAKEARRTFPQMAVVYVTGDSAGDWPSEGVPGSVCIQKPFVAAQIITALANQLNGLPPSP